MATSFCDKLEWDTEFFGVPIARVSVDCPSWSQLEETLTWCRENGVACLYFRADSSDYDSIRFAEENGFQLFDAGLTFCRDLVAAKPISMLSGDFEVSSARSSEIEIVKNLARTSHGHSRFLADPNFENERVGDMFAEWIQKAWDRNPEDVLVARNMDGVLGYITCEADHGVSSSARIGLLAVSKRARGHGVGTNLVASAEQLCRRRSIDLLQVVTQGANIAAQRLYQRCGFLTIGSHLWYHLWLCAKE